jgi:hypothetical protein
MARKGNRKFMLALILSACWYIPAYAQTGNEAPAEKPLFGPGPVEDAPEFELLQNRFGGVTITGYKGTETTVLIPETMGGLPVTIIGNKAFYRKDLVSVTIPSSVVTIEPLAFAENRLGSVEISGCVSIGYEAFAGNELSAVTFSERLSSIGQRAFYNNKLTDITIPGRVNNIGKDAFAANPLRIISMGVNRNIFASQGFEPSFVNYYTGTGRRAGVYVKDEQVWSLRPPSNPDPEEPAENPID